MLRVVCRFDPEKRILSVNHLFRGKFSMKKIIVLLLSLVAVIAVFTACQKDLENEDIGTTIPIYLTEEIANFDPAYSNLDAASQKVLGLIYEGLFKINANGKVVKAQAKSVKILDDPDDDYYAIEIKLKKTSWSDDTPVLAADYIYAWKRILQLDFRGEAASMLFDIKNARAVNTGDASVDDLGVTDVATDVLRIEFESKINYDKFYEYLASPMLVPLRETAVDKVEKDWSSSSSVVVCNGPFCVRTYNPGEKLVLERNRYYYRDNEEDSIKEYVTPYRLVINFNKDASENLADLEAGSIVYDGAIPLDKREEYKDKADVTDSMNVLSYVFNTTVAPFDNADVRNALSLAIDRNEIVKILTFAKPVGGLIGDGVFNTGYNGKNTESFRDAGGELISASADLDEAKALISKANPSVKDIKITVRDREEDKAVAEYVKTVWESLGFTVTIEPLAFQKYQDEKEYDLVADKYLEAYESRSFQVISVDNMMLTTDAFANLAQYSKAFASGFLNLDIEENEEYELATHISGYYNPDYEAKIEEAFAEKLDLNKRAELLHEAEAIIIKDMPVIPLVQLQHASVTTGDIDKLDREYFGFDHFIKAVLKNISKYPDNVGYETEAAAE